LSAWQPTVFTRILIVGVWAALALAACNPAPEPGEALTPATPVPSLPPTGPARTSTAAPTGTPPAGQTPATEMPPASTPNPPEVEQARADLAQRLNVLPTDVEIVSVQEIAWSDASMGCPQPGLNYVQVETPGWLIQLAHAGQAYAYHSGGGQPPFLCEQTLPG
jgi:hypothetical protein